jgi:hypothetical protein
MKLFIQKIVEYFILQLLTALFSNFIYTSLFTSSGFMKFQADKDSVHFSPYI